MLAKLICWLTHHEPEDVASTAYWTRKGVVYQPYTIHCKRCGTVMLRVSRMMLRHE